jgi:hypothetical protein
VIFPGFAWSNWKDGYADKPNQIPRRGGDFFWLQAYYTTLLGTGAYIAMFDEFDEGTAIAKAATSKHYAPNGKYFLTLDEDGIKMSSDFYLRLAGAATRMIQAQANLTQSVPIPFYDNSGRNGVRRPSGRAGSSEP